MSLGAAFRFSTAALVAMVARKNVRKVRAYIMAVWRELDSKVRIDLR